MKFLFKTLIFIPLLNFQFSLAQNSIPVTEIEDKLSETPKYILIEFYTDWCGICAIQQKKIRKNESLTYLLENEFHYVKFNAESEESFVFNGRLFKNENRKIHEFAEIFFPDTIGFPAWVILNSELEIIFQHGGLMEAEDLELVLKQIL